MEHNYYFAYGSNMDEEQMKHRCPDAKKVSNAFLICYRFAIDIAHVATVIKAPAEYVEGILWLISPEDEKRLDMYEGVSKGCYRKKYPCVVGKDGEFYEPLVYISNRAENKDPRPFGDPSPYMQRILECARENRFRADYIEKLESCALL